jgi:hypothetical protein
MMNVQKGVIVTIKFQGRGRYAMVVVDINYLDRTLDVIPLLTQR